MGAESKSSIEFTARIEVSDNRKRVNAILEPPATSKRLRAPIQRGGYSDWAGVGRYAA